MSKSIRMSGAGAILVGLTLAMAGCAPETTDAGSTDDALVAKVLASAATVHPDRLEFPRATFNDDLRRRIDAYQAALASGKTKADVENVILVGDREDGATTEDGEIKGDSKNPYGYIRRAIAWRDEGSTTIVTTEVASLEEAFSELSDNGMVTIGGASTLNAEGVGTTRQALGAKIPFKLANIDFSNTELFRAGPAAVRIRSGSLSLDTSIDFDAQVRGFSLNSAHLVIDATVQSKVLLEIATDGPLSKSFEKEIFHKQFKLAKIGPVSLSVDVRANVDCSLETDTAFALTGGLEAELVAFQAGVEYRKNDGGLDVVGKAPAFDPKVIPPKLEGNGKAKALCTVTPAIQVFLFDQSGPVLTPSVTTRFDAKNPPYEAQIGASTSATLRGPLSVFGKKLGSVNREIFSIERSPIWTNASK